jgi:hypothetical protein
MARDPQARFADAAGFAATLQRLQAVLGLAVTDRPADVPTEFPPGAVSPDADTAPLALTGPAASVRPPAGAGSGSGSGSGSGETMLRADRREGQPAVPPRVPSGRLRRMWWALLIGGAAILLAAAAGVAGIRSHTAARTTAVTTTSSGAAGAGTGAAGAGPVPDPSTTPSPTASRAASSPAATTARSAAAVPAPPAGGRVTPALLGAPDFGGYCAATGQGSVALKSNDAYGWRCTADNGTGDDAQSVCQWTYRTTKVANRVTNFNDPHSWQCWRANGKLGALNFTAYCTATGFTGATNTGTDAYGWYCAGTGNGIDTQAACALLYGSQPPISRFQNFYDKNSWECWG